MNENTNNPPEDECMICLEPILDTHKTAKVSCCPTKIYHAECFTQFATISNSCPICRKRFHQVEITHQKNIEIIPIKDRLLPNPAIDDIPSQYIIREQPPRNPVVEEINDGVCYICTRSTRNGLFCNQCGCNFHLNCLGVVEAEDSLSWCCPICDYHQETIIPTRSVRPRGTNNINLARNNRVRNVIEGTKRNHSGLVIHNDNDELDVDFLYHDESHNGGDDDYEPHFHLHSPHNPVINGGVISRREQKQKAKLSIEEVKSWDMFDKARVGTEVTPESSSVEPSQDKRQRRKRKKVTPIETSSTASLAVPSSSSSRISQLIGSLKTSKSKPLSYNQPQPTTTTNTFIPSDSPMSISPAANSPMESVSYSSDDNEYTRQKQPPKELTLDQKVEIQKHIRNKLRPFTII
ncbi:hypothetical protein G210_2143 [Candida maltosa Xu316]|uniref:RING-type domain-containing protein n=1 Tax=Candida maltosa (strain Xu316) TaxID=1245528 RepID=M3IVE7_CANMX|nr:hypothetical protein G210_2143 [Candida maltosa Xu316]